MVNLDNLSANDLTITGGIDEEYQVKLEDVSVTPSFDYSIGKERGYIDVLTEKYPKLNENHIEDIFDYVESFFSKSQEAIEPTEVLLEHGLGVDEIYYMELLFEHNLEMMKKGGTTLIMIDGALEFRDNGSVVLSPKETNIMKQMVRNSSKKSENDSSSGGYKGFFDGGSPNSGSPIFGKSRVKSISDKLKGAKITEKKNGKEYTYTLE